VRRSGWRWRGRSSASPSSWLLDEPFAALDALTRLRMQSLVAELCARHHPGVLLVTHDVEEAILLADRVLVLADSRISLDSIVELPRPRRVGGETFDELRDRLLAELGVLAGKREDQAISAEVDTEPAFALSDLGK
jgi:ABC-type nitrate/sulfonate/bicarbonate transport system ATPase subunit